jgi:Domain of unknown function (DUF1905)
MDEQFTGVLERRAGTGGWTYVVWPDAAKILGTHGAAKVRGTVDGHEFRSSIMAMGQGVQMLPVKADLRKAIGKDGGDLVTVRILERL